MVPQETTKFIPHNRPTSEFGIPDEYNDPYRYITGTSDKALSIGN